MEAGAAVIERDLNLRSKSGAVLITEEDNEGKFRDEDVTKPVRSAAVVTLDDDNNTLKPESLERKHTERRTGKFRIRWKHCNGREEYLGTNEC